MCMFKYIYLYICMHACMHAYMYLSMHACMHACIYIYIPTPRYWLIYRLYLLLYVQSSFRMVPSSFLSIKFIQPSVIFSDRFWYILFITCRASKWSPQILIPETPPENLRIFFMFPSQITIKPPGGEIALVPKRANIASGSGHDLGVPVDLLLIWSNLLRLVISVV